MLLTPIDGVREMVEKTGDERDLNGSSFQYFTDFLGLR